jgi:hypothetical protein
VIEKLGFEPTGEILRDCAARGGQAQCLTYRLARARAFALLAAEPPNPAVAALRRELG